MSEITLKIDIPKDIETMLHALLSGQAAPAISAPIEDEIWNTKDICDAFKIPKTKLYSLTMQTGEGSLPRFKVGRDLRFKKSEVISWFNRQRA